MTLSTRHDPSAPASVRAPLVLLGTTRASLVFVITVFVATVIQVLATPTIALWEAPDLEWPLPTSIPVTYGLLIAGCALQAVSLTMFSRRPGTTVTVVVALHLALAAGLGVPTWVVGMHIVIAGALFLVATRVSTARVAALCSAVVVVESAVLLWFALGSGESVTVGIGWVAAHVVSLAAPAVAGTALGVWWATKTRRMQQAREEAELATQEHAERVAAAQERERARIAQELHDVAGQHLAGLITLTDAALSVAPTHADEALALLRDVRDEGRFAAAGLAGALADLRAGGVAPSGTTRDVRRLAELVEFWRERGASVEATIRGDVDSLPAVVSTTAFRCVQEALTNAAKHAPRAPVRIEIIRDTRRLSGTVANAAPDALEQRRAVGLGWGLSGMRERVEILGGTFTAGADAGGGWTLGFEIPVASTGTERP
ncbi:sensor histidine kinase [Microbacterium oleivorans]|uniref:sensor histidine kinase n=1 Tax=Microbacterium oleivorans TaxID=273677 RepID=UPI0020403E1E|nr:histidine kinase [Microbacterium oleivorans]MCM3697040.1 histidine kinase [Microbacterium oleivorans]